MVFNTSNSSITQQDYSVLLCQYWLQCKIHSNANRRTVAETTELDPIYQLLYDTHAMKTPDSNQQRVRILLWLKRMNCNVS